MLKNFALSFVKLLGSVINGEQVFLCQRWRNLGSIHARIGDRFLEIFLHQNRDGAIVVVKSDVHAQKHVMFSSGHGHFTKLGFTVFDNVGHYRVIDMRDFVVVNIPVNIPGNCVLLSFKLAVRDA